MRAIVWRQFRRHPAALFALTVARGRDVASCSPRDRPYDPNTSTPADRWAPPSAEHCSARTSRVGTCCSRILYGGRISLAVGFLAMAVSVHARDVAWGPPRAVREWLARRHPDAAHGLLPDRSPRSSSCCSCRIYSVRRTSTSSAAGSGNVVHGHRLTSWMVVARLVRAASSSSARRSMSTPPDPTGLAAGTSRSPASCPALTTGSSSSPRHVAVADAILIESGLSFLGYGIQAPAIRWGNISGRYSLRSACTPG